MDYFWTKLIKKMREKYRCKIFLVLNIFLKTYPPQDGIEFTAKKSMVKLHKQEASRYFCREFVETRMFGQSRSNASSGTNALSTEKSTFSQNSGGDSTLPSTSDSTMTGTSNLLKDLLVSANNLPKADDMELGSIHLTLNELQRRSQQLRKAQDKENNFMKAHYLLASSGMSAEEIENEIKQIRVPEPDAKGTLPSSSNLETYLSTKKDENILSSIEQSLNIASKDFDAFISANVTIDWRARKEELRKYVGLSSNSNNDSTSSAPIVWNKLIPGSYNILSSFNGRHQASLKQLPREKFESHAKIVYQLNEARLEERFFPLLLNFEELNKLSSNLKSKQMSEVYKILVQLTNESYAKVNQEHKFYDDYKSNQMSKKIIKGSKSYLELQFFSYMSELYSKNEKNTSTTPTSNIVKVSHFIHQIIVKNEPDILEKTLTVNATPVWALIFYLLRSGLYDEALDYTLKNKELFNKLDKNFPIYLKKYVESGDGTLPHELRERLQQEFTQQFAFVNESDGNNFDAYKFSIYKIIGKCDLSNKTLPSAINLSIEDWLWFHLSIISNSIDSDLIFENYTLQNLQKRVISLGSKKFNSSSNNPLYLKTLVLVGLYELAVQYTYESISECDAVHLSIGLIYYGLLNVTSFSSKDELIVFNDKYEVNFARLIGSYTRAFKISDPKVASQYLVLIALSKGNEPSDEISKCHEALRELILISREFSMLLGDLNQENGEKTPGILERQRSLIALPNLADFYHQITEVSALRCEEEGRVFDALLLYQLCQDFNTVVSLINKLLSELLSTTDLDQPLIDLGHYESLNGEVKKSDTSDNNIILLSQQIMKSFESNSTISDKISPQKKETCNFLLPIINIREVFLKQNFQQALHEIRDLHLLPLGLNDDLIEIRKLSDLVKNGYLDDDVVKVIPSLLIMTITSISQMSYLILTKKFQSSNNERDELLNLRKLAKNCMIYAGMVQYKMPRETYSLLINLEALL
ncbi:uncharacterized protein PRCAT00004028001 [Priceomyces carsonii]|uniref:uncharacterized protein n=1 Tax=Priceomyces carsonii TaxID=28549 RepID=UPI002ED9FCD3|nr:unnamed protein product [Priceomyces carsonii]